MDLILNFLTEKRSEGLSYNTINGYRSAISAYHEGFGDLSAGQHPLVKRLLTGIYNECPPKPKYTGTWDVEKVLTSLEQLGPDSQLDDAQHSHKLAMLLALTTAGRASDLQALELDYMADKGDRIEFTLTSPTKTSKPWKPRPVLVVKEFPGRPLVDPASCLRNYIRRTRLWRKTKYQHRLLLGLVPPHNPVVTSTISNWLKKVMAAAGIDVTTYQGHSTRSAATSKARAAGLSVTEIVQRANWTNAGTFQKFYNRADSIETDQFAEVVLSPPL